jgi:hypothetical protein
VKRQLAGAEVSRCGWSDSSERFTVTKKVFIDYGRPNSQYVGPDSYVTISYSDHVGGGNSTVTIALPYGAFGAIRRHLTAATRDRRNADRRNRRAKKLLDHRTD